ncbi:histidinol-phosphate transaminase [Papillibacter cinnamivorans]|uniref:Histidinol-phosphate aminotransferase n=1 Tax=Papillibacter cinnamivorans DSM 12816 TaxID=1122930 RepID=A0A1W1YLB1_9FIRM|nr:histidinol-phosphate transaminase [Papillibacter cinnamivorans]SMC36929.1 histidinol-phosphate aminotransferase [Papillibacter cinnamivorans DSM 12816]
MNKYWSPRIRDLKAYVPGEQPRDRILVKLNTNENPYPPSAKVLEAVKNTADGRLRLYPDPDCVSFREAVARQYKLLPENVFPGNGSDELLAFCFLAFFGPGRPVLFPDITYSFYPVYADLFAVPFTPVPLDAEFRIPVSEFCRENGGVIFPNPNAPTGIPLAISQVETVLKANPDSVVIVDEAYIDFGGESAVGLIPRYPNLLVTHTLSKFRSLAGLRAGYALGDKELIAALDCVKNSFNSYTMDRVALAAAEAAVEDTEYFRLLAGRIAATRDKTAEALRSMGFLVLPSAANFLFASHKTVSGEYLQKGLRERGILVRRFQKPRIENFLRISMGTEEQMELLIKALEELLK